MLQWLDRDASSRPQFMAMYFNEPDHSGHKYGPYSTQVHVCIISDVQGMIWGKPESVKLPSRHIELASDCAKIFVRWQHTRFKLRLSCLVAAALQAHLILSCQSMLRSWQSLHIA